MSPKTRTEIPRIAPATSPSHPDRIAIAFLGGRDIRWRSFPTPAERDEFIEKQVADGSAKRMHAGCGTSGCAGTVPTLKLREDRDGNVSLGVVLPRRRVRCP